jgi:hypothetical protein
MYASASMLNMTSNKTPGYMSRKVDFKPLSTRHSGINNYASPDRFLQKLSYGIHSDRRFEQPLFYNP